MNANMMKVLKWIFIGLITLLLIAAIGGWFAWQSASPNYNLDTTLSGLGATVEVYYDEYGIPHIYGDHETDVYRAMGYVHAKDRLWQMELVRRIAPGRLSELFGEATVETDRFFKTLGLTAYSEASVERMNAQMDPHIRSLVEAYIDGINQFIENGETPVEFTILGIEKTPYKKIDLYNVLGYMSFSFAMAHKTEPILSHILEEHGETYLADLMITVDSNSTHILSGTATKEIEALSMGVHQMMDQLPAAPFIGSNSWVVSGAKSKTGKVLFANDPHIGFSQPAVWYEAHLETPNQKIYGYWLAGFPFPQLTHSDHHAIGLTMFENDDIDLFYEKQHPENADQYEYKGEWLTYEQRKEVIKVKDGEDVTLHIKSTVHGPIINDGVKGLAETAPVSMWWTYMLFDNQNVEASYLLGTAQSLEEAQAAASLIHAPGLNIMYGDVEGNIAWWAAAKLPIRPAHVNSKLILDGSTGLDDPLGFYDFSENPQSVNPDWGYVYSANNQSISPSGKRHPGYYLPEDRARRIVELMEQKDDWTTEDYKEMLVDCTSRNAPETSRSMVAAIESANPSAEAVAAKQLLSEWDGQFDVNSVGPTIYNKMVYHVSHDLFADELGEALFDVFNGTHLMKRSFQPLFANEDSPWWDNVGTPDEVETRTMVITRAFEKTVAELVTQLGTDHRTWTWGKVHTLEHNHSFSAVPSLKPYFNVGPFSVAGNSETINNMHIKWNKDGTYAVFAGPSTRRIVDFADVEGNSWSILPTGQSGNVLSEHYQDQAKMFSNGLFRKQLMNADEIKQSSSAKTVFSVK